MADPDIELTPGTGGARPAGNEALPRITKQNRGLYVLVLWFLGAALLIGLIGWIVLALVDKPVPEALPILCATVVGGFVGIVSGDRGSGS